MDLLGVGRLLSCLLLVETCMEQNEGETQPRRSQLQEPKRFPTVLLLNPTDKPNAQTHTYFQYIGRCVDTNSYWDTYRKIIHKHAIYMYGHDEKSGPGPVTCVGAMCSRIGQRRRRRGFDLSAKSLRELQLVFRRTPLWAMA